ncbi:MAG TPA: helix-hairpin-helix domain-containing protein [Salinivirgaceae bacterium]|nr:helix-hairpin-helix domain-containing protein [Salinivirgaceae bacterium]
MSTLWKDINSYTKGQKRALLLIWGIIITIIIYGQVQKRYFSRSATVPMLDTTLIQLITSELNTVIDTIPLTFFNPNSDTEDQLISSGVPENIATKIVNLRSKGKRYNSPDDLRIIYGMTDSLFDEILPYIVIESKDFTKPKTIKQDKKIRLTEKFDPNKTPLDKLLEIGMPEYIAKTIVNYVKSGGKFAKSEDLMTLYTIDTSTYLQIKPYVTIEIATKEIKFEISKVELNTTTTSELSKSSGENFNVCGKIISYRNKLGGFLNQDQIDEIEDIPDSSKTNILNHIWIDPIQAKKINVNQADYKTLIQHPYVSKDFATKLIRYRNFVKEIKNSDELIKNRVATKQEIARLTEYLEF